MRYSEEKRQKFIDMKRCAMRGDAEAAWQLGWRYTYGHDGFEKNPVLGFRYFETAASAGHAPARVSRAHCYLHGRGVERQPEKGIAELEAASAEGALNAKSALASLYMRGEHLPEDRPRGMAMYKEIYQELMADPIRHSRYDYAIINYPLGLLFGIGVPADRLAATELLREAAAAGFENARRILRNREVATTHIPRRMTQKERDFVGPYYPLSGVLHETAGVALLPPSVQDPTSGGGHEDALKREEFANIKRRAAQGDIGACYELGAYYYRRGVKHVAAEMPDIAFSYIDRAAKAGHLEAIAERADMYVSGCGTAKQRERGLKELHDVYRRGLVSAGARLAKYYIKGYNHVQQDEAQGCRIYKEIYETLTRSVASGQCRANFIIGDRAVVQYPLCLILGVGVAADPKLGAQLLKQAAGAGFYEAEDIVRDKKTCVFSLPKSLSWEEMERHDFYYPLEVVLG